MAILTGGNGYGSERLSNKRSLRNFVAGMVQAEILNCLHPLLNKFEQTSKS
jgi:hypothetical protein